MKGFLIDPRSHFNLANLFTMVNITAGLLATYFITQNNFTLAIILAWIGGAFDIFDGKIARKFALSNEFGIQLDSFADFLSFVLVPVFLIFQAVYSNLEGISLIAAAVVSIYYVISGLLGAILLWLVYLANAYQFLSPFGVMIAMLLIGWSLNSKLKVPHP